jgi:hypothetical protein
MKMMFPKKLWEPVLVIFGITFIIQYIVLPGFKSNDNNHIFFSGTISAFLILFSTLYINHYWMTYLKSKK